MYNRSNDGREGEDRDRRRDRDRERDRDYHHRGSGSSGHHHHHYRSDRDRDRDNRHGSGDDDYRHRDRDHRKSRSRWDSKESSSKPSSRWDRQPEEAQELGSKLSGTGAAVSRWDKKDDSERSLLSHDTFGDRERRRKSRSRSRSSSPFQRSDRDYSRYSNPSRSDVMERALGTVENNCTNDATKKTGSNWSDSSDEEEEKYKKREGQKETNSSRNSQISTFGADSGENPKFSSSSNPYPTGLSLKLDPLPKPSMPLPKILSVTKSAKSTNVASVFNDSDDDEPEEMPAECKMRMKNVGRDTKTSEGPNSFGKTKIGFCNVRHLTGKELEGSTNPVPPSKSHKKY